MKKALLSIFVVLSMVVSATAPTYASANSTTDANNVISFEAYYAAVKDEYANYHVEYDCTDNDENFVFTKGLLDQTLADIREQFSDVEYDTSTNSFKSSEEITQSVISKSPTLESIVSPNTLFNTRNYVCDRTVQSPAVAGWATIRVTTNVTEDVSSGVFVNINSCTSRQYGAAVNFISWQHNSNNLAIVDGASINDQLVSGFVYGTLVVEYTDPNTGLKGTYTSDHQVLVEFICAAA